MRGHRRRDLSKSGLCLLLVSLSSCLPQALSGPQQQDTRKEPAFTVLAGGRERGLVDGPGHLARFNCLEGVALDKQGNLYVTDRCNHRIRKIDVNGNVTTVAGSGSTHPDTFGWLPGGFADGPSSQAQFNIPSEVALDKQGNLFVTDSNNRRIRKITLDGNVITFAGNGEIRSRTMRNFFQNISALTVPLAADGIAIDANDNIYVTSERSVQKISPEGIITTVAESFSGGLYSALRNSLAIDKAGNLFVSSYVHHLIHRISPAREVIEYSGQTTPCAFNSDVDLACEGGGFVDGPAAMAQFNLPIDLAVDTQDNLYVLEQRNQSIRLITPDGIVHTLVKFSYPDGSPFSGIAIDENNNVFLTAGTYIVRLRLKELLNDKSQWPLVLDRSVTQMPD